MEKKENKNRNENAKNENKNVKNRNLNRQAGRRILTLCIVSALTISLLYGCGEKTPEPDVSTGDAGTEDMTTESAAGNESVEAPEAETDVTEELVEAEPYPYTIDYHKYPQLLLDTFGGHVIEETCETIDAFLDGKSSVTWDTYEIGEEPRIISCLSVMCPLFSALAVVPYDAMDDSTKTLTWESSCTEEELADYRQKFEEKTAYYLDQLQAGDGELLRTAIIYSAYAGNIDYDYDLCDHMSEMSLAESSFRGSGYAAIVEETGICYSLSEGLTFLLTQADINSIPVGNYESDSGNGAHEWNLVQIDGEYYYADATWDMYWEKGAAGLVHFGMTSDERYTEGGYGIDKTTIFVYQEPKLSTFKIDDDRFRDLHSDDFYLVKSLVFDHVGQKIIATDSCDNEVVIQ